MYYFILCIKVEIKILIVQCYGIDFFEYQCTNEREWPCFNIYQDTSPYDFLIHLIVSLNAAALPCKRR